MVTSILDNDLYKFTMQAAVLQHYPKQHVTYKLINRSAEQRLSLEAVSWLKQRVLELGCLRLTTDEQSFLCKSCPYFTEQYLAFLKNLRLEPATEISIRYDERSSSIDLTVQGLWSHVILYEVPVLALVSEAYFLYVDKAWSHNGQYAGGLRKGSSLLEAGLAFCDFGTRRRRDYTTQDLVLQGLCQAAADVATGHFLGTSNVHFAQKYNLRPVGTVAHEWVMAIAAIDHDYIHANRTAMQKWRETFSSALAIALPDTFGTENFLRCFSRDLASAMEGVRQDSGDPRTFTRRLVDFYKSHGIDISTKTIVFSDSLNITKCISLSEFAKGKGIKCNFGIGTFLTNDFETSNGAHSPAMNIVIKIVEVDGKPTIKISDDEGKVMGPPELVKQVKELLNRD